MAGTGSPRRTLEGMRDWDHDLDQPRRPSSERSRQHAVRLVGLVVAAGIVMLLMVLLIGPLFNSAQ